MARSSNREPTPARRRGGGVDRGETPPLNTGPIGAGAPIEPLAIRREFPVAQPIQPENPTGLTPFPEGDPQVPPLPIEPTEFRFPRPELELEPFGRFRFCSVSMPDGCYQLTVRPNAGFTEYRGTLRLDRAEGSLTASGDLYRYSRLIGPLHESILETGATLSSARLSGLVAERFRRPTIPIHPINRYHSYLKVTNIRLFSFLPPGGTCNATITAEEYNYTQPPAGSFNGTFPSAPGTRTVTFSVHTVSGPTLTGGPRLEGTMFVGGSAVGTVDLLWVSKFFRKCTVEIDTLTGAVAPQPVPALAGSKAAAAGLANEDFKTMLASAGWDARIEFDQTAVAVPAGVNANACWSNANLHALMQNVRKATTNLDTEWRLHCVVVPATMGCSRGIMYDTIQVPREGVASFSNDGYPTSNSANFGTAANQQQRNVPRAFLRSCSHEIVHGFNQIHQESEGGADNSIMTTTPSVADVLGGPTSGDPGVFPTDIKLEVNEHVRHHLIHMPDICVRPGGMTFGSGHGGAFVPQADRYTFAVGELMLTVEVQQPDVVIGEPVPIRYTLTNTGTEPLPVPAEITTESTYTTITVIDPKGRAKEMPPYVIRCESAGITELAPGASLTAETRVFWSAEGFAFTGPGAHVVDVAIMWTGDGVPCLVRGQATVTVSAPIATGDEEAATTLLHPQVGQFVALGGGAMHLTDAVSRLQSLGVGGRGDTADGRKSATKPRALRGFDGLLPPSRIELEQPRRERVSDAPAKKASKATAGSRRR